MKSLFSCAACLSIAVVFCAWQVSAKDQPKPVKVDQPATSTKAAVKKKKSVIGRHMPNFIRPSSAGKEVALSDFGDAKLVVVIFMGTECPIGNAYVPDLVALQQRYPDKQVQVIGINSVLSDSAGTVARYVKEFKIDFPVLIDNDQTIADRFGAQRTPEIFVLDGQRKIRYRGRIDDRFGYIYKREESRRQELEEALKELLAGKDVSVPETEPVGCLITRKKRLAETGKVTFAKHVAGILLDRCANCHHPGTAAPFSLLSYKDARNWSEMIKETIVQRRMPPWNADPRYGHFSNDLRMTDQEIDTVVAWIDNGSPLGDKKDLPKPREFADGWTIGKPDRVFKMPREYTVPATGTVKYQYFVTPTNFKEDMWIQAAEARPGNHAVVHHIIAYYRDPKSARKRGLPAIVGTAPGEEPMIWPKGIGIKVPAGSEIVWQLHYTPTGKVEKDRSEVGLIFCKEPPRRVARSRAALNFRFRIPAGADHHQVVSSTRFSKDAELLSLMPHMHLRGKDFRYTAHYPDGSNEILLNVPSYDFNWQHRYRFDKPHHVPKGTKIECVAHFDNSNGNPANPDATKPVRWGDQTWEEMMIGFINYIDAPPKETPAADSSASE
ncbi:MAG: redoxin domain-containing protein [Planctomycetaceae bacterium]|nr:redoxin domain-containing protein [Planctomycetaceae bacterium]